MNEMWLIVYTWSRIERPAWAFEYNCRWPGWLPPNLRDIESTSDCRLCRSSPNDGLHFQKIDSSHCYFALNLSFKFLPLLKLCVLSAWLNSWPPSNTAPIIHSLRFIGYDYKSPSEASNLKVDVEDKSEQIKSRRLVLKFKLHSTGLGFDFLISKKYFQFIDWNVQTKNPTPTA